jgi:hypothetical protein
MIDPRNIGRPPPSGTDLALNMHITTQSIVPWKGGSEADMWRRGVDRGEPPHAHDAPSYSHGCTAAVLLFRAQATRVRALPLPRSSRRCCRWTTRSSSPAPTTAPSDAGPSYETSGGLEGGGERVMTGLVGEGLEDSGLRDLRGASLA